MSHDHSHSWEEAQAEELEFWNTPGAELGEQLKQLTYAKYLQLNFVHDGSSPFVIDKTGQNILDIGGGPVSLLLKTLANHKVVADPCDYPDWVADRYAVNGVDFQRLPGEKIKQLNQNEFYDEVWMYNVLQHTQDPMQIFANIYDTLKPGGTFRFLDWVDTPTNTAHPLTFTQESLADHLKNYYDQPVLKTYINENGAIGTIAYGVFTK